MGLIDERLRALGVTLPEPRAALANYVLAVRTGNLVFTAGQISRSETSEYVGKLGSDFTVEEGQKAARVCALNCLAAVLTQVESLDHVRRIVRVGAFVNSAPDFVQQPAVANGASDFLVSVFGDAGKHARTAVGVGALPFNSAVEIDMVVEVAE